MARTLVGSRIRDRREALGLKQTALAAAVGVSPSYLNLIEHNKRGIAGKILLDIARVLEVDISALSEGADTALVQDLQAAAAQRDVPVEIERMEELVARFPGWARLIARTHRDAAHLARTVDGLSDRLTHDPFLSESLHEVLSTVTAIRSTSSILARHDDIPDDQMQRFHANLHSESQRLSETSEALVSYFDQVAKAEQTLSTPLDEVEAFLSGHNFHFPTLEEGGDIEPLIEDAPQLRSQASKGIAAAHLARYVTDARAIPLPDLLSTPHGFAPDAIAAAFDVSLHTVFRRLAFLPNDQGLPDFGLVVCDGSGAVTLRKSLSGFALPRYGAACPLWPLYQSIARPAVPSRTVLRTPEALRFLTYAYCHQRPTSGFDGPQILEAMMLFQPLPQNQTFDAAADHEVGLSCRICPRENCAARREPTILGSNAPLI